MPRATPLGRCGNQSALHKTRRATKVDLPGTAYATGSVRCGELLLGLKPALAARNRARLKGSRRPRGASAAWLWSDSVCDPSREGVGVVKALPVRNNMTSEGRQAMRVERAAHLNGVIRPEQQHHRSRKHPREPGRTTTPSGRYRFEPKIWYLAAYPCATLPAERWKSRRGRGWPRKAISNEQNLRRKDAWMRPESRAKSRVLLSFQLLPCSLQPAAVSC